MATPSNRVNGGTPTATGKRRKYKRSGEFQPIGLRIESEQSHASIYRTPDYGGGRPGHHPAIDARLVDVSKGGLGVETLAPLPLATVVIVQGELHSVEECYEFRARAWVVHCLAREDGCFRVGLNFQKLEAQELECEHEPGDTIEAFV